jgi:membrane protein involved in colicin uptake
MTIAFEIVWSLIQKYWKPIAGILALALADWNGSHRVHVQWDAANAVASQIKAQAQQKDAEARKSIEAQHKKDIEYAKSEAGKSAVREYLRTHGLLSSCPTLPSAGSGASSGPQSSNGTTGKPGTSGAIEAFAGRCRGDAAKVELCTRWIIEEKFEVE